MDAAAQLALMAKATKVFSSNSGTFLSFPVTPLAFKKEQLNLLADPTLHNIQEFSMLANMIPAGVAWVPGGGDCLWDVYESIIQRATYASSSRTDDEEIKYKAACGVLSITDADGNSTDSIQVIQYAHYQSLYEKANQAYISQSSTASSLMDATEIKTWTEVTEPKLRDDVANALNQWVTQGYQNEVDTARDTKRRLGEKSPLITRREWTKRFNPDIDSQSQAIGGSNVYPTTYSPANALDENAWSPFEITEAELAQLLSEAPSELRAILDVGAAGSSIESIKFEFSSAKLMRGWFQSEAFNARFWRFDDGHVLSDGGNPAHGECTSYPVAVVFARKVAVKPKLPPADPNPSGQFTGFQIRPEVIMSLRNLNLQKLPVNTVTAANLPPKTATTSPAGQVNTPVASRPLMTAMPLMAVRPMMLNPVLLTTARVSTASQGNQTAVTATRMVAPPITPIAVNRPVQMNMVLLRQAQQSAAISNSIQTNQSGPTPNQANVPENPASGQQAPDDSIYILAFVCKPLPRCPDPDQSLQW